MSKNNPDSLFQLIKSLSKSEKRYFRIYSEMLHQKENKKFMTLFDLMDSQKNYNESQLLKRSKEINPIQLSNLKSNLQKQLLHSLRMYNTSGNLDIQIRNHIDYCQILYNKGLFQQAVKMLEKARKMATQAERPVLLLDIIDMEKKLIAQTVSDKNEERVNKIISDSEHVSESIENIHIFSNLFTKLNAYYVKLGFIKDHKEYLKVKEFFYNSLPKYNEKTLSFNEKLYLYQSFLSYYFFIKDFENGYKYALRYINLFEENPDLRKLNAEAYIKGLNYLLVAQNKLFKFREFEVTYKKLLKVHAIPGFQITENLQMMLFKYKYMHKINRYFMMGDFKGGLKIISVVESELDRLALKMDLHYVLIFYYKVACLYFGAGHYKKALNWLYKIVNSKEVNLREDILSSARILILICHFETRNIDLLEYHIKSTYRYLLRKEGLYRYHFFILDFLKQLTSEMWGDKLIRQFAELKSKLTPLENDTYEKRPFLYFDIINWLESKISNTSLEEILKKKWINAMKE